MHLNRTRMCGLGMLGAFIAFAGALTASAAPTFDAALRPYVSGQTRSSGMVNVIALFHDSQALPRVRYSPANRLYVQQLMQRNTEMSQRRTIAALREYMREKNVVIRSKRLWIINALILTMPANSLSVLAKMNDIRHVSADYKVALVRPVVGQLVDPRVTRSSGSAFTYGLQKMQIPALRQSNPNLTGQGVRVGVIDTGIDGQHPELKGRVVAFKDFIAGRKEAYDDNGHGTHCSGTIGGIGASGTQIGVAPGVQFVGAKFLDKEGGGSWTGALESMQFMADPDGNPNTNDAPSVVSNSWSGGGSDDGKDPASEPLCQAAAAWVRLGIVPVFAAGNSGPSAETVGLPGACPGVFTIGATDSRDQAANFSSRGPVVWKTGRFTKPDVAAPGVKILSSIPGGKYAEYSGTSMATPHVAGMAALMFQVNPKIDVGVLMGVAKETTDAVGSDPNVFGSGRVNAVKAMQKVATTRAQF